MHGGDSRWTLRGAIPSRDILDAPDPASRPRGALLVAARRSVPPNEPDVRLPGSHRYVLEADEHQVLEPDPLDAVHAHAPLGGRAILLTLPVHLLQKCGVHVQLARCFSNANKAAIPPG